MAKRETLTLRWAYLAGVLLLFAAVAALRADLTAEVLARASRIFARGGAARLRIVFEGGLLLVILGAVARIIAEGAKPKRDAAIFAAAAVCGWAAEAWGTRTGLWRYYTLEKPPLWIVPAWPLGALVIDRAAAYWSAAVKRRPPAWAAPAAALAALAVFVWFTRPAWGFASTWAVGAALAAGLFYKPDKDLAFVLAAGFAAVFFADFWGTSANCWSYHNETRALASRLVGVLFGMCFDTAVVVLARRAGRYFL